MKRKLLYLLFALVVFGICFRFYAAFHPSRAFLSHGPANQWHVVDCVLGGSTDVSFNFRAHDLRVNPFRPVLVGDLYWETKYYSGDLFWSRDGTVAAASIVFYSEDREAIACAYDFREHRAIRSGQHGSPLDDSKEQEIRRLLDSRGGYDRVKMPSFKEI